MQPVITRPTSLAGRRQYSSSSSDTVPSSLLAHVVIGAIAMRLRRTKFGARARGSNNLLCSICSMLFGIVGFVRPDRQGWISLPIAVFAKVGSDRVVDLTHVLFAHAVAVHDKPG